MPFSFRQSLATVALFSAGIVALILGGCSNGRGSSGAESGYLEGHATIGPLTPVERVDTPPPTPSAQLCMSVGIAILSEDGTKEIATLNLQGDCSYRVELKPGNYIVRLKTGIGLPFSKDLPKAVEIESGKSSRLDFDIDTGIR
jgi:hypothetical protein